MGGWPMCTVLTLASSASGLTAGGISVPILHSHEQGLHIPGPGPVPHPPAHHVPLLSTSLPPLEQDRLPLQFLQHWHRAGLLILLSLTLFVINCDRLRPRPQVSYLLAFYLCWCASVLMLWAGTLSFFNQVRMWSYTTPLMERRVSFFRWASRQKLPPQPNLDQNQSAASCFVNYHGAPSRGDSATSQDTEESPQPDASTSVPVTQSPSNLP